MSTESGDVVYVLLDGLAQGVDLHDIHRSVGDRYMSDRTMSPRVLLDLAAEAFVTCQVSRDAPLESDGLDRPVASGVGRAGEHGSPEGGATRCRQRF